MPSANARNLEERAAETERSSKLKSSNNAALQDTIRSAELYMQALRLADTSRDRVRLDAKCKELLTRAEYIKSNLGGRSASEASTASQRSTTGPLSTRKLTTRENIIVLEGSKLNGFIFKPWVEAPSSSEFELRDGDDPYLDQPALSMSADQIKSFDGWERPAEALRAPSSSSGPNVPVTPVMNVPDKIDLVQDLASDCSVVASMCVGTARAERGHPRILSQIVYPYDDVNNHVKISPNGKYVLRLYFNGCWRRVEIDDMLPTSRTSRVLHVVDRSHPGLLWPALIEKAYLKVRGGYDFPGSNSGTDLEVLTGWIPQQVFLHDEEVEPDALWTETFQAFEKGDVLLTIGTGKLPWREQKQLGLAAEHDYAILDMKTRHSVKEMLIKNPWSDGDVWKGATRRRPNPSHENDEPLSPSTQETVEMLPGTFWMEFHNVFQYFENMYLNWNPGLFDYRQDRHFTWSIPDQPSAPNIFTDNPQFQVQTKQDDEIWILLNRHFRTGDFTHENSGRNGYISVYLYEKRGCRVLSTEGAKVRGPFVDSPYTLLRFEALAGRSYTTVVVAQELAPGKHNFTISAFSRAQAIFQEATPFHQHQSSLESAWTRDTAGGNSDSLRYLQNPQFSFIVSAANTPVTVASRLLSDRANAVDQTNIHVKLWLLYSPAQGARNATKLTSHRITRLRPRDSVATSGDYRRGSAVLDTTLAPGIYTLICSTFDENQLASFSLDLYHSSSTQVELRKIPPEDAGRFCASSGRIGFEKGIGRLVAPLTVPAMCKAFCKVLVSGASDRRFSQASCLYKLSIEQGQGPYRTIVGTSAADEAEFDSVARGVRIEDTRLMPSAKTAGGLWLALERPVQSASDDTGDALEVEIYGEERIEMGPWSAADL